MRNILLTITIFIFHSSLFGQNPDKIKTHLDSIADIISGLPKSGSFTHDSKYELTYSEGFKNIIITAQHFEKNSNKKKTDQNVYTFDLADLDPNFVMITAFESPEYFYIQMLTINNEPKIKQEVFGEENALLISYQDRVTMGRWEKEQSEKGEKIKSLFISAITEVLGDRANIPRTTKAGRIDEIDQAKNDSSEESPLTYESREEDPVYIFGFTDKIPSFQGAKDKNETEKNLEKYFKGRIKNDKPQSSGTVYIQFTIDKTGRPTDINILKGANESLDKLAIDFTNEMPVWEPGQHNGEHVLVVYMTSIKF